MAPDDSGGLRNSASAGKSRHVLKKGPWTTAEDMILVEYVKKHGEGNWNAVQRNSGLMRCGKSCRLRWANHLRPNLKKGAFSAEEEKLIVDLHAKLGNKWARMAAQLPGRTDNEIKNYWNTRLKRRQRAGLPVYPQEVQQEHHHQLNSSSSSPSPYSLSSLLASSSSSQSPNLNHHFTFTSPQENHQLHPNNPSIYINHHDLKGYRANNGSLALSLAALSSSSISSPVGPYFNPVPSPSPVLPMPNSLLQYNYGGHHEMGALGLPSIQSPATTASSSDFVIAPTTSSNDGGDQDYEATEPAAGFSLQQRNKSGLLEDLLGESEALGCHREPVEDPFVSGNVHEKEGFGLLKDHGDCSSDKNDEGQESKAITCIDDDLLNLLDNFPLSVPIPEWNNEGHGSESPTLINGATGTMESQRDDLGYIPVANSTGKANQDRNFGPCLWNNMPSIY